MTVTVRTDEGGIPVAMIDPAARLKAEEYRAVKQGFWDAWNPRYRAITDKKNRGEWIERFSVYLDGQYSARAYHKAVELRTHTSRNRKIRALAQEMLGKSVADVVPLPAFPSEQVREYIRASKAASTLRGYKSDWRHFCAWCEGHNQCPLPASSEITAVRQSDCRPQRQGR
jgi:hypothetical protein